MASQGGYQVYPADGYPPGWQWRSWPDDTVEQLADDAGGVRASVDWGSSPVEYTVGGTTHLFVPEYRMAGGSHVAVAEGTEDVRTAIAEELSRASPQPGVRETVREAAGVVHGPAEAVPHARLAER